MYNPWVTGSYPTVIEHTTPVDPGSGGEFTAVLHGKL
jgi:hypothetical protein